MSQTSAAPLALFHDYLRAQRGHVLSMVDGLDDAQLDRPVLPSGWTCLSLLHHLRMNELLWFRCVLAGDPDAIAELATGEDWGVPDGGDPASVLAAYRAQIERSEEILASVTTEQEFAWWPDFFGEWRLDGVPELMLHVITEVACHAGHLDAARELIDGRQFLVLD